MSIRNSATLAKTLLLSLLFGLSSPAVSQSASTLLSSETTPARNLKVLGAAWERVNTKYFDPNFGGLDWGAVRVKYQPRALAARDKQELLIVLKEMLGEIKSSHLYVWRTVSEKSIERKIEAEFDPRNDSLALGYGFDLRKMGNRMVVIRVSPNSSAQVQKVAPGWTLVGLDDNQSSKVWDPNTVIEGTTRVFWFEDISKALHKVTLTAQWLVVRPIRDSRVLDDGTRYIRFSGFRGGTSKWLETELKRISGGGRVVIDLRGNRGGLMEEVRKCLGHFFEKDTELGDFVERSSKVKEPMVKGKNEDAFKGPVIVLVDEETASGGEIFAQVIQENGRGRIVGSRTGGMVLNSVEYELPEDFMISVAIRNYISPKGKRLEGTGVIPDFDAGLTIDDLAAARDGVLTKALSLLQ